MNILFYTSFSERSITLESTILYFLKKEHQVFFLTTCAKGQIHKELERKGVSCHSSFNEGDGFVFKNMYNIIFLIRFCRKNNIDMIHSHLQLPNLYAVFANYFIKAKVLTVRHNSDIIFLFGTKKERLIEKIINLLSPCIIAISKKVKNQLVQFEKVNPLKIVQINNGYDFSMYEELSNLSEYNELLRKYTNQFVILSPGRLIESKRHKVCIEAVGELIKSHANIQLVIIGDGPEKERLNLLIEKLNLTANISLVGYKENIVDYIKIANAVVQLSITEASNNVIKEAAYFEKNCIACNEVGDFSDYMIHNENGFLLQKSDPKLQFISCINLLIENKIDFGKNLKNEVLNQFDIEKIGKDYDILHSELFYK